MLELPNLEYNYYYPFYTQKTTGKKKYFYRVETIMHLSEDRGILVSIEYELQKKKTIALKKLDDAQLLYRERYNSPCISYPDFAKEVKAVYLLLRNAVKTLSEETPYIKVLIFGCYFKYNRQMEFTMDRSEIKLEYGNFDYKIEDGKKIFQVKAKPETHYREEDELFEKLQIAHDTLQAYTTYRDVKEKDFVDKLDWEWAFYAKYFEAPKFIRKTGYKL